MCLKGGNTSYLFHNTYSSFRPILVYIVNWDTYTITFTIYRGQGLQIKITDK